MQITRLLLGLALAGLALGCATERQPVFWVQPYVQNPAPTEMSVLWWTHQSQPESVVEYGVTALDREAAATNDYIAEMDKWLHEARISGLTAETAYLYRVRSGEDASDQYGWQTTRRPTSNVRISILGDSRTDDPVVIARHRSLVSMAGASDLIFELGDTVEDGSAEHWGRFLRRILTASDPDDPGATTGSRVPLQLVVGNHEIADLPPGFEGTPTDADYFAAPFRSMARFKAIAAQPPNGSADPRWHERYYTLTYGAVTFIALDANNTSADDLDNHDFLADGSTPDWEPGSEQHDWLKRELARAQQESVLTIVMAHPSPYSSGVHGTPDREQDQQRGYELRVLEPLFRQYGVDAVITSHDHLAERSLVGTGPAGDVGDEGNVNYFVVGNSGSNSRQAADGWESWMSVGGDGQPPFFSQWRYDWATDERFASMLELDLRNNGDGTWTAVFRVRRNDGAVFDEISVVRRQPGQ